MSGFINELALLLLLATVLGTVTRLLRQPLIIAYLAAGGILAYFGVIDLVEQETFETFSNLGIMFLLFLVGLEINYPSLKLVGKASIYIGVGQVVIASGLGYLLATLLGFANLHALYIGIGLAFSSTIIVVKLLSDKKDSASLYGKISIGFLLVQDLLAIIFLVILTSLEGGSSVSAAAILIALAKAFILFGLMLWLGKTIMPYLFEKVARSQELLFLCSIAWVIFVAALVERLGLNIEIAGFLAGLALANASETHQIANRIRPLRDFFMLMFFISLGASFALSDFSGAVTPILALSVFVLIGNPIIVMILMGLLGYKRRTGLLTGLTTAQVSEFSLILAAVGLKIGHVDDATVGVITGVAIVTIAASTYLIVNGEKIYRLLSPALRIFERKNTTEQSIAGTLPKPITLVGFHRTGQSLARNLKKSDLLVVDFDPEIRDALIKGKYEHIFGDITDDEVLDKAITPATKLIISTSPDPEDNIQLLTIVSRKKRRPKVVVRADNEENALLFYDHGADYVLVPHFVSGHHLGKTIASDPSMFAFKKLKSADIKILARR